MATASPRPGGLRRTVPVDQLLATPEDAGKVITEDVWPTINEEYARLRARPV